MQLGRQDQAQEGSQAGWFWGFLCGKHWHQEPSPDSQQETLPCLVTEDLPASPGKEVKDPCPSTTSSAHSPWDSSRSWESGSSEADGCCCFVPGAPRDSLEEVEKGVGMAKEETALQVLLEQLQGREQPHSWWVQDEAEQLRFLHTITPLCIAAQQRGQDTLEPHCSKAAVVERIVQEDITAKVMRQLYAIRSLRRCLSLYRGAA
ncbi:uncharacterized protein LOC122457002 [Dermochelys coriacea]|uniref:uncharacterized protein LOC122457002 n=1 Tax=Dermochelys coriacea TaxID=27794 RepID=UPI001CA9E3DB|nr:uncharacterized protein LOC122457002 [Dermochelys coriacea]